MLKLTTLLSLALFLSCNPAVEETDPACTLEEMTLLRNDLKRLYEAQKYTSIFRRFELAEAAWCNALTEEKKISLWKEIEKINEMAVVAEEFYSLELNVEGIYKVSGEDTIRIINGQVIRGYIYPIFRHSEYLDPPRFPQPTPHKRLPQLSQYFASGSLSS